MSLIELLVVIAVVSILLGLLAGSLAKTRQRVRDSICLSNLRALANAAYCYAGDDRRDVLLPVHPLANVDESYLDGFFDFGGADGSRSLFDGRYSGGGRWNAASRPLNRLVPFDDRRTIYECPSDLGVAKGRIMVGIEEPEFDAGSFPTVGTSYWGNAVKTDSVFSEKLPLRPPIWSFGPYLRPANRVPVPAETVLFSEPTLPAALRRLGQPSNPSYRAVVSDPTSWHSVNAFPIAFADGHAGSIRLSDGTTLTDRNYTGDANWYLYMRSAGLRWDCFPDGMLLDLP